jgi:hypothetical protein
MGNEEIRVGTGMKEEVISLIETRNAGFLVSVKRAVKVGKTASEMTEIKLEGYAKDQTEALQVLSQLDAATMKFIGDEAAFYGIDLKARRE